ncbi:MAG TPA: 2-isopropylmalate synthase [Planctomycetota bacterium]|nr:2-isopropylmalate synthase [Planctomycetota bacterium]
MDEIIVFDTTLRDGEQSPGASMNTAEKLEVARALDLLGVDVIEAGFPIASPDDWKAVNEIAKLLERPVVCGLARCREGDIEAAASALEPAKHPRIHVFLATSEIHRKFKLEKAKPEILKLAVEGTRMAKTFTDDVQFSPEDAARTELDFLCEVVEAVIDAGATTVNIPDTVGYSVPPRFRQIIETLYEKVPNIGKAVIAVHCHNDLGLAVANSLAAVEAGARQIECTINGLGERAGNCSLEEVVMALRVRSDHFKRSVNIDTTRLVPTSRLVARVTGIHVQRNKAIVGENAFAHEAGIHQHGMLKDASTYEIMRPEDVGLSASKLVLGKHSGRHAFQKRIEELGYDLDEDQFERAFGYFKVLADRKKEIFDEDLKAIVQDEIQKIPQTWELLSFHTTSGSGTIPTATVRMKKTGEDALTDAACGDGPVDAIYNTIERVTGVSAKLTDYEIHAVTGGKDAQGEVSLALEIGKRKVRGRGVSTDILEASAKAFVNAVNLYLYETGEASDPEKK